MLLRDIQGHFIKNLQTLYRNGKFQPNRKAEHFCERPLGRYDASMNVQDELMQEK
jgi:hypothetical protein